MDDFFNNYSYIKITDEKNNLIDSISRKRKSSGFRLKYYYKNIIKLSNKTFNSLDDIYKYYAKYRLLYLNKNSELLYIIFNQEYYYSNKKLFKLQLLDGEYNIRETLTLNEIVFTNNICFRILLKNKKQIYDYYGYTNLNELFTANKCYDTYKLLLKQFNKYKTIYNNIEQIDIVNLKNYQIIDSYNKKAIYDGYIVLN